MKSNRLKEKPKPPKAEKENGSKRKKQKKTTAKSKKKRERKPVPPAIKNIAGIFFLLVSLYLLLAFIFFFINWFKSNPEGVTAGITDSGAYFDNHTGIVRSWTGNLGAWLSRLFVLNGLGLGAMFVSVILFDWGLRLLFKKALLKTLGYIQILLLGFLWLPVLMAVIFPNHPENILGGLFGHQLYLWLTDWIGSAGLIIALIFLPAIFLAVDVTLAQRKFPKLRRKKDSAAPVENSAAINTETLKEDLYNTVEFSVEDEEPAENTETETSTQKPVINPIEQEKEPVEDSEVELTIEKPKEEAKADIKKMQQGEHTGIDEQFDPRMDLPDFRFPGIDLLNDYDSEIVKVDREEIEANKQKIVKTLQDYSISIVKIKATVGPAITLYEIVPAPGIRIAKIKNLEDDIALSLSAMGIRIIAPIPGRGTIGIEVPNRNPSIVSMKSILESERFQNSNMELPLGLGKTISNESYVVDLAKMPHILMAGATGQGKSVGLNAIITSLLYKKHPAELKFIMVDPKKVELTLYSRIERHYLAKLPDSEEAIITDTRKVVRTLNSLSIEMDNRYELLKDAQVRNIKEYNKKFKARKLNPLHGHRFLPYIVLVIDEFADLIMTAGKEVENPITRLAQLARAVGIHLIIATQRPSVNIITGTIKANFPARIAFRVIQKVDSRTILDQGGADRLVGKGDMLLSTGSDMIRLQCAFIDTEEVERLTDYIGQQRAYPDAMHLPEYYDEEVDGPTEVDLDERDPLFEDAARLIVQTQQGSTSLLQRKLKLGYNRAGRIIDQLEAAGIVGPFEGSKAREVKVANEMALEQFLKDLENKNNKEDDV